MKEQLRLAVPVMMLMCSVEAKAQATAKTTMDTELGGFFLSATDGSPWTAYGAYIGVLSEYAASFFHPRAIKATYTRFHVFKPSDDQEWNWFPYTALRNYEASEVAAGRPPIFATATYQGKKRPVLWAWSLGLTRQIDGTPTTPPEKWEYAVNIGDERFIRFWINQYIRPIMWQTMYNVPNLWWGLDESAFFYTFVYGVLDDNNRFVRGVPWDPPMPQNQDEYAAAVNAFFSRVKALAPDIKTAANLGSMDNPLKFSTPFANIAGILLEGYYDPNPSGDDRTGWIPYFDGVAWFAEQGRVGVLRALISRTDTAMNPYGIYQLLKGPDFFFAPAFADNGAGVPRAQYAQMDADLGNPIALFQSVRESGLSDGYRLFWRVFDGGIVYVNWTGHPKAVVLPLDRTYFDRNGTPVSQITIADGASAYVRTTFAPKTAKPSINPRIATAAQGPLTITMASDTPGAAIHYTLDGRDPTAASPTYTGSIALSSSATVKAIAIAPQFATSVTAAASYTIAGTPQVQFFSPTDSGPPGTFFPLLSLTAVPRAPVTVSYRLTEPSGTVTQGSVNFLDGEVYRHFPAPASGPDGSSVGVTITGATNAVLGPGVQFGYTINPSNGAVMILPPPGSQLSGSSAMFTWSTAPGVTQYHLDVGRTDPGSRDILSLSTGTRTSQIVSGLPTTGGTLYVRLWSYTGAWEYKDYTYQMASLARATMLTPTPGSTVPGGSVTFNWNAGVGVTEYYIYVGTVPGGRDIYSTSTSLSRSAVVTNVPANRTIYVRLWSLLGASWEYGDYTYSTLP